MSFRSQRRTKSEATARYRPSGLNRRQALLVPGCHDALSARVIENAGFEAIQVSGLFVWGGGSMALFDATGNVLPAASVFGAH